MYFLGTCKLSIAILGNSLFMSALLFYKLVTRVCSIPMIVPAPCFPNHSTELAHGKGADPPLLHANVESDHIHLQIFLGRLRESEVERINERLHHGVVEICLTLTVFRQDFDARLILLMGVLAMVKVFHWLIQDRINYMQTEPAITYMQHIRTASFLTILLVRNSAPVCEASLPCILTLTSETVAGVGFI